MDADGTLWVLEYGSVWYFNNNGRIRRLRPADGNHPPVVTVANKGSDFTATATDPDGDPVTIQWWLTAGSSESMIGTGATLTHHAGGSELRAVATDAKGAVAVARVSLTTEHAEPSLQLEFASHPKQLGFGEAVEFVVTGATDPSKLVVRARYISPTGHDSGGPQFSAAVEKLVTSKQCLACHQVDRPSIGPAYLSVALKYRDEVAALATLQAKVKSGGSGVWGAVPMPPQTTVAEAEGETIIRAILGLAEGMVETSGSSKGTLTLAEKSAALEAGGAWEISAEAPGCAAARTRIPAR